MVCSEHSRSCTYAGAAVFSDTAASQLSEASSFFVEDIFKTLYYLPQMLSMHVRRSRSLRCALFRAHARVENHSLTRATHSERAQASSRLPKDIWISEFTALSWGGGGSVKL